jgi:hypothetical protein
MFVLMVLTKRGRIEADIDVGIAIMDGAVTGNYHSQRTRSAGKGRKS